jgi:hypothetical protein
MRDDPATITTGLDVPSGKKDFFNDPATVGHKGAGCCSSIWQEEDSWHKHSLPPLGLIFSREAMNVVVS